MRHYSATARFVGCNWSSELANKRPNESLATAAAEQETPHSIGPKKRLQYAEELEVKIFEIHSDSSSSSSSA